MSRTVHHATGRMGEATVTLPCDSCGREVTLHDYQGTGRYVGRCHDTPPNRLARRTGWDGCGARNVLTPGADA